MLEEGERRVEIRDTLEQLKGWWSVMTDVGGHLGRDQDFHFPKLKVPIRNPDVSGRVNYNKDGSKAPM